MLEVCEAVAEVSLGLLGAEAASVNRYDAAERQYRTLVNVGQLAVGEQRFPEHETYPASEYPVVTRMLLQGQGYTAALTSAHGVPDENLRTMARFGRSACLGAPITYQGTAWGELFVSRNHGREPFTDAELALARDLAQQIAFGAVRAEVRN